MKRLVFFAAILLDVAAASAQNYGAPRGDYARSIGESYPQPYGAGRARPTWSGNPMIQVCPDGYGYGPTRSGELPKCVPPEDGKNAGGGLK